MMSTADIRAESHQLLDRIDERFLVAVHALLSAYEQQADDEAIGYRIGTGEPLLVSEADDAFEAIVKDVKEGNYKVLEEHGFRIFDGHVE